jgi:2,5-diamino-6-(ribosylamino)-4(3H)-pyrimidinone 5'-phosphate reductase
MSADPAVQGAPADIDPPAVLHRLIPPGPDTDPDTFVQALELRTEPPSDPSRPRVLLNMASTADGRVSLGGRSGAIGNRADRELFIALRGAVDAVLVGAGTARTERYGRIIRDPERRDRRARQGLSQEPLACIASARLSLPADLPLLAERDARVVVLTASERSLTGAAAHIDYVRATRAGTLDLPLALVQLRERFAVEVLLCEGGPHLNHDLLAAGVVDEVFLSFAPKLAGGDDPQQETLRIAAGDELPQLVELDLLSALESESQLFLRYGVRAVASGPASTADAVSAETTRSRSLAS